MLQQYGMANKEEIVDGYLGEKAEIPRPPGGGHPLLKKGDALFASFNLTGFRNLAGL
jgi:hypothetical protein